MILSQLAIFGMGNGAEKYFLSCGILKKREISYLFPMSLNAIVFREP